MAVFLVTGGAGFIGSRLVEALVGRGDEVRVVDNFSSGRMTNLLRVQEKIEIFAGDVGNRELLSRAARGVECIYHFAAAPPEAYVDLDNVSGGWGNSTGTLNLLNVARDAGVRRVIYASSGSMYGHLNALQMKESDPILPLSPFDFIELTGEHQCIAFASFFGLETVRLRYFNVFGPRQCPSSPHAAAIPIILKAMLAERAPVLTENVYEYQDFLYVDDAVHAALLAAAEKRAAGKVYNIARGRPVNLLGLVAVANEIFQTHIEPVYTRRRSDDYPRKSVCVIKAEAELGFCARTDLKQGLQAMIDYYGREAEQIRTDAPVERTTDNRHEPVNPASTNHLAKDTEP